MGVSQRGHADAGVTIDFRSGMRTMHTFKKLPIINPNRNTKTLMRVGEATHRICHIQAAFSSGAIGQHARLLTHSWALSWGCHSHVPSPPCSTAIGKPD